MKQRLAILFLSGFVLVSGPGQGAAVDGAQSNSPELRPGGDATSRSAAIGRKAFTHASGNLAFGKKLNFKLGNAVFGKLWVSSPASTKSSDGLGPLYNARSCQRCHIRNGRGHPPRANWPDDNAVSMLMRLSIRPRDATEKALLRSGKQSTIPSPVYGGQLQDFALQGHDHEGRWTVHYTFRSVQLGDGQVVHLREPRYRLEHLKYGQPEPGLMMSPRIAPQMIGLGLLEAVPEADLLAREDPDDHDADEISGRANRVWSARENRLKIGRFGWKAGMATLRQQTAAAFSNDLGLSSSLFTAPYGDCTEHQSVCRDAPHGADNGHEINDQLLSLVAFYTRQLAVPPRRNADAANVVRGRRLFRDSGCAACHTPSHKTGADVGDPNLRNQVIWPYTDLLLHDMGEGLADHRPEGKANGREWRTPPLWGIGLTKTVSGHTFFLHDGRARNVLEAILWHGGEAQASRESFAALPASDRDALIAFVNSL